MPRVYLKGRSDGITTDPLLRYSISSAHNNNNNNNKNKNNKNNHNNDLTSLDVQTRYDIVTTATVLTITCSGCSFKMAV